MNKNLDDFQNRKIGHNQIIAPIIAIFVFIMIVGGFSYAYFSFTSVSSNNTVWTNAGFPQTCNKTFTVVKGDCSTDINAQFLSEDNVGNKIHKSDCELAVTINGCAGDYCTYDVALENVSGAVYTPCATFPSGANEYTGLISAVGAVTNSAIVPETQMNTLATIGTLASGHNLSVQTSNVSRGQGYILETNFFNINADQSCLLSESSTTTFRHILKITNLNCNFNH